MFLFGLLVLVADVRSLVRGPFTPWSWSLVFGVGFSIACVYVGIRYRYFVATAPPHERLIWVGVVFTGFKGVVSIARTLSELAANGASPVDRLLYVLFLLGTLALAIGLWLLVLGSVRFHADQARRSREDSE